MLLHITQHITTPCSDLLLLLPPLNTTAALIVTIHPFYRLIANAIMQRPPPDSMKIQRGLQEMASCSRGINFDALLFRVHLDFVAISLGG
jgi:hypothetical protein